MVIQQNNDMKDEHQSSELNIPEQPLVMKGILKRASNFDSNGVFSFGLEQHRKKVQL